MCSLFDGIGGFPLIWERDCGGTTLWQSEIEDYCNAVTEKRFPLSRRLVCGFCGEVFYSDDEIGGLCPAECPRCGEESLISYYSQTVKAEREREREVEPQTVGTIVKGIAKQVVNTQDSTMVAEVIFNKAEGFDAYNQKSTGGVMKSLTSIKTDSDHIPVAVCTMREETETD